jgi:hypothetical protein
MWQHQSAFVSPRIPRLSSGPSLSKTSFHKSFLDSVVEQPCHTLSLLEYFKTGLANFNPKDGNIIR